MILKHFTTSRAGFTLIEVVLALGVFLISILALIGLLSPMLKSVSEVEKTDEITSVVNTVNAFLQSSPEIGDLDEDPPVTKFEAIYEAVASNDHATVFVFRRYVGDSTEVKLIIGFESGESGPAADALLGTGDFNNAAGPVYRVVLSASPVTPDDWLDDATERDANSGVFTLATEDPSVYPEGYLAMEARIFAEDPPAPGTNFAQSKELADLVDVEPDFTFNTAIVR